MKPNPNPNRTRALLLSLLASMALTLAPAAAAKAQAPVELPAGSADGLAAAIALAGPGGTVVVKSGLHTESGTVVVDIPVRIIGEPGAVIACGTTPSPLLFPVSPAYAKPTLHILGADNVTVRGLHFVPAYGAANCAVLVQNADQATIAGNQISGFQFGVLVQHGDRTTISDNIIDCVPLWAIDPSFGFVVAGINVLNGEYARIIGNQITGAFFGIFANDSYGRISGNTASWNYIGYQMCRSMYGILAIAGTGEWLGADVACNNWHVQDNDSSHNYACGYLVIDGAHDNVLNNNAASDNPLDIILTGDGDFFGVGIPLPASHDNVVAQGSHKGLTIMDCGVDNEVSDDATLVPCP